MYKYIWMHTCNVVHFKVKRQLGELILFFTTWISGTESKFSGLAVCPHFFFFNDLNILSL